MAEPLTEHAEHALVKEIADELTRCRWRGIDDLELRAHNKPPRPTPQLDRLADTYCGVTGIAVHGRVAAIRTLLHEGLRAYAEQGNAPESQFIARLFFDPDNRVPKKRPDELLQEAQRDSGLEPDPFAEKRRAAFERFAVFLLTFVADAQDDVQQEQRTAPIGEGVDGVPAVTSLPGPHWSLRAWLTPGLAGLVVLSGLIVGLVLVSHRAPNQLTTHPPTATSSRYVPGKSYGETAGQYGSPTFTDPYSPSAMGPRISPYEPVQVSCKVFAPTIPSISPDGYWYRVVSPAPYKNLYTPATNFLNGDSVTGARKHYTDFAVPDCPA